LFLQFLRILFAPPAPADYLSLAALAPLRALRVAASFPQWSFFFIHIPGSFVQFLGILFAPPMPADCLSLAALASLRALRVAASFPQRSFVFIDIPGSFVQFLRILFCTSYARRLFVPRSAGPFARSACRRKFSTAILCFHRHSRFVPSIFENPFSHLLRGRTTCLLRDWPLCRPFRVLAKMSGMGKCGRVGFEHGVPGKPRRPAQLQLTIVAYFVSFVKGQEV
jgi:hypothetical protein